MTDNNDDTQIKDKFYSLIRSEFGYTFDYLNLYKKDYFTIIATIIAIFGVIGYFLVNKDTVYWLPFSFLFILFAAFLIACYNFYICYIKERQTHFNDNLNDVISLDLFFINLRPILYSISLLFFINTICLIVLISGMIDIPNIKDVFLNYFYPGLHYANASTNATVEQILKIDTLIKNFQIVLITIFVFQTAIIILFSFIIQKLKPPYVMTRYILKVLSQLKGLIIQRRIDTKKLISSIYYIVMRTEPHFFWIGYFIFVALFGFLIISLFTYYMGIPEITLNSFKVIQGGLICLIQLIFFFLLFDYFANSQVYFHYQERLNRLQDIKYTIELNELQDNKNNLDRNSLLDEFNLLNIYSTKKIGIFQLFRITIFSFNPISFRLINPEKIKHNFNFEDEKIMKISHLWVLFCKLSVLFVFSLPILKSFFSLSETNNLLGLLFMICGFILVYLMNMILPKAFDSED